MGQSPQKAGGTLQVDQSGSVTLYLCPSTGDVTWILVLRFPNYLTSPDTVVFGRLASFLASRLSTVNENSVKEAVSAETD